MVPLFLMTHKPEEDRSGILQSVSLLEFISFVLWFDGGCGMKIV